MPRPKTKTKPTPPPPAPKPTPEPRLGTTKQIMLSVYSETEDQLAYLCRRVAERQGGNPDRLKSPIVRALIAGEYQRERGREEQETRAPR